MFEVGQSILYRFYEFPAFGIAHGVISKVGSGETIRVVQNGEEWIVDKDRVLLFPVANVSGRRPSFMRFSQAVDSRYWTMPVGWEA